MDDYVRTQSSGADLRSARVWRLRRQTSKKNAWPPRADYLLLPFTNHKVADDFAAVKFVRAHIKCWGVEEAGRIQKQAFQLEDLRVLT